MEVKMGVSAVSLQPRQGLVRDFAGAFYGGSLLTPVRIHQQLSVCQPLVDLLATSHSLPLDSVVWYRVYTFSERSDRDGYPLNWTSCAKSRGRCGNGAVLRARGLAGGTAAPGLRLSS